MKQTNAEAPPDVFSITAIPAAANDWSSTRSFDLYRESARGAAMSPTETLFCSPLRTTDRAAPRAFACLIEVPDVKHSARGSTRPRGMGRWDRGQAVRPRGKRRLRREVRVAGCALLAIAPFFAACTLSQADRPARLLACSIAEATASDRVLASTGNSRENDNESLDAALAAPENVVVSSEAAPAAAGGDAEVPVVFPGYVLPDDSREEPTHEGS